MESTGLIKNIATIEGKRIDILLEKGIIKKISEGDTLEGNILFDGSDSFVSTGWIDMHVHAFSDFSPYGDEIDAIGVKQGVTTIVDAGSCGANRINELYQRAQQSQTNVLAFINISNIGLERIDELSNLDWINQHQCIAACKLYEDMIIGLKTRISSSVVKGNGVIPLEKAIEISNEISLPIMTHIGSAPPKIEDVIPLLRKGDIITHYLNGKENNLFDENGEPLTVLKDAVDRGVYLDVGHGNASFSFKVAQQARKAHVKFNTISTDIYKKNRVEGPVFSLSNVLTKFLCLGYTLEDIISAVTTMPAKIIDRPELAELKEGIKANLTIFDVSDNNQKLIDSDNQIMNSSKIIKERGVVSNGRFIKL
ncbi:amidohydrolase/deacetylase family metallohydrolase [Staphylococcus succinus]|uniref:amidohydrolase/deacetylase family metallohydrolase n=1 Tax=Staphylococcus succinus TaxID=61015 RepID=UPI00062B4DDE|nr:amidohydrolase/deacetylase family metallohydrolase [Staphylococcus succinus]MDH9160577.1 amidohydrolase/deacetylase family metallohydrolase [Staphylococcus succinus]PNZ17532.1 amidohydrolase/deacetylase family metallohydrolase [Staphylococcus succinus subsp. succinus]